jgi:hypothetical protein
MHFPEMAVLGAATAVVAAWVAWELSVFSRLLCVLDRRG